eukprot:1731174-Pleurochrysis_carterae.AAC.2
MARPTACAASERSSSTGTARAEWKMADAAALLRERGTQASESAAQMPEAAASWKAFAPSDVGRR